MSDEGTRLCAMLDVASQIQRANLGVNEVLLVNEADEPIALLVLDRDQGPAHSTEAGD